MRPHYGLRNAAVALINAVENLEAGIGFTDTTRTKNYRHWMFRATQVLTHDEAVQLIDELTQVLQERMALLRSGEKTQDETLTQ